MNDEIDDSCAIDDEDAVMGCVEAEIDLHEPERQDRLWLRSCIMFVDAVQKPNKSSLHVRTQHAVNMAVQAACERAVRIFNSDLPPSDLGEPFKLPPIDDSEREVG